MTKLAIVNAALTLTGNAKLDKWDDARPEAAIARCHFDLCCDEALERSPWSFARSTAYLDAGLDGDFEFTHAATLPTDAIKSRNFYLLPDCFEASEGIRCYRCDDFEEIDCKIYWGRKHCPPPKGSRPYIEYTAKVDPARWSPTFRKALMYRMAAVFARSINEENGEAAQYDAMAERAFGMAAVKSAQRKKTLDPDERTMGRIVHRRKFGVLRGRTYGSY